MNILRIAVTMACILITGLGYSATYYNQTGQSNMNTLGSWTVNSNGTEGTAPGNFTTTGDIFIIRAGTSVTLSANWTFGNSNNMTLTVESGATFNTSTRTVTMRSNFVNNGGTVTGTGPWVITGTLTAQSIGSFTTTGTVSMTKTGGVATFTGDVDGGAFTINGSGGTLNLGTSLTHTFTGTFTRTAGTLNGGSSILQLGGAVSGTGGTFTAASGTVVYNGAAQTMAVVTYNNLTLAGTGGKTFNTGTTTVNGILSIENGTSANTFTGTLSYGGSATLQYNTASNRTVSTEWVSPFVATGGVIIANTGTITLNGAKQIGSNTNVDLTINSGATLATSNNGLTFHGDFVNNGTLTAGSSSFTLAGTVSTQSIDGFTTTGGVSMTKTSGTATLTGNVTAATLTLNGNGGTLDLGAGLTHDFSGGLTRTAGTFNGGSSITSFGGSASGTGAAFNANTSTIRWDGAAQNIAGMTYYNIELAGSGTKTLSTQLTTVNNDFVLSGTVTTTTSVGLTIGNDLIIGNGTSFNAAGFSLSVGGTLTVDNNGNFDITSATGAKSFNNIVVNSGGSFDNATVNLALAVSGDITNNGTLSAGSGVYTLSGSAKTISGTVVIASVTVTGTYQNDGTLTVNTALSGSGTLTNGASGTLNIGGTSGITTLTATASGNIVNYTSGSAQSVKTTSYHHLNFSGAGTKTPGSGTLSVAGNWDVGSTTALNTNNPTVSVTGNISGSGSITSTSGTLSIGGSWNNNGTFTHNSGTVNYNNATGGQTIASLTYRNLTLSNTSGTNAAAGDITVVNLSISNAGATLNMGTHALSVSGTTPNAGTIRTQHVATTTPLTSDLTWNSNIEYDASSGGQTVVAGTYVNLKSNNTSGTNTAGGAITVNGPLTVASGGTLDMATFALSGSSFSTSGTGAIKTQYSLAGALPSGTTWTTSVEYNRSGPQTIVSGTYSTLITSGSGTKTMSGNSTVTSALTLNAGTLAVSTNTITIQTNAVTKTSGSLSVSAGTIVFDFNNTLSLPNSFFSGGVNNMTLSSGAIVNLPATPNVQAMAGTLNLSSGKLGLGTSATLALGGTVSNMSATNCIVGNGTGSIEIAGSGALGTLFFDQTTPGTTNTINNFTVNRTNLSGTLTIGNTLRIKTLLTPNFGTVTSNGNLVIGSDANGTAKILEINPANFAFVGDVKAERYTKSKNMRRFLFMSSVVDIISVRNAWQDDIFITGSGTGGTPCGAGTGNGGLTDKYNSNGFDATTANVVTMYRYDQNDAARWVAIPNTSFTLQKGRGYRVLYRGARGVNDANCADYLMLNTPSAPSLTTLNVSGTLIQGSFTVDIDGPTTGTYGYTLLGNPYACELDFGEFAAQNPIAPTYWTYDPNGTTNNTSYLSYTSSPPDVAGVYHSDPGGNPDNYPNPGFIAAGQAFFVQADADGQVTFSESQKAVETQNGLFKTTQVILSKIRIHFRQSDNTPIDNILIRFSDDPGVTTAENKYWDAITFNSGNFMASIKGTRSFAIQTRPLNFFNDTVQLRIVSTTTGNFKLEFTNYANFVEAAQIILIDQFTGTQTDVKQNPVYPFTITSSSASQAGRFKIVFRSMSSLLPLSYINVSATQKTQGVEVNWKVAFEQGVSKYLVERSEDGSSFSAIGAVESKGNSNLPVDYTYMDIKPLKGTTYYRIKSVEAGQGKYSPVVKVNSTVGQPAVVLYPNPVKERLTIALQHLGSFEKASITIKNTQGKTIRHMANVSVNGSIIDVRDLAVGMYILTLTNQQGETIIEKFVKY